MDRVLGSCIPGMEMDRDEEGLDLSLSLQRSPSSPPPRFQPVFACCYCPRKFRSSQALGGHQNAHKLQRNLARRGRESASSAPPAAPVAVAADQGNNAAGSESAPVLPTTAELGVDAWGEGGTTAQLGVVDAWGEGGTTAELGVDAWGEGRHHRRQGTAGGASSASASSAARGTGEVKDEMIDLSLKL